MGCSAIKVVRDHRDHPPNFKSVQSYAATPEGTHFDLVLRSLQVGKHESIEKPVATSAHKAGKLINESEKHQQILMVGFCTGAERFRKSLIPDSPGICIIVARHVSS